MKNKLISFSGIDGAGKSTQIVLMQKYLEERGSSVKYLWVRGGYTKIFSLLKNLIRFILKKKISPPGRNEHRKKIIEKRWVAKLWLYIAIFDLVLVYGIYVRWLLFNGKNVLADRYLFDTWIDFKLNFPKINFDKWLIWKFLCKFKKSPDISFLLLIPVEESLKRSKFKDEPFPDNEEVLEKRLEFYKEKSKRDKVETLNCLESVESIQAHIRSSLEINENI